MLTRKNTILILFEYRLMWTSEHSVFSTTLNFSSRHLARSLALSLALKNRDPVSRSLALHCPTIRTF